MQGRAGLVEEDPGLGGLRHWKTGEQGLRLTRALPQQGAASGHRLEARLEELSQRRVLLMVLQRRRQRLQGWRHRSLHWDRCCKCASRACQRRRWHCLDREGRGCWLVRGREKSWLASQGHTQCGNRVH